MSAISYISSYIHYYLIKLFSSPAPKSLPAPPSNDSAKTKIDDEFVLL